MNERMVRNQSTNRRRVRLSRSAFTLTELMVSIVIISILASVTLYAMASVQTQAKAQRTKAQLARIHDLLLEQLESYDGRVPRRTQNGGVTLTAQQERVCALRETMRLEMPDRMTDVLQFNSSGTAPATSAGRALTCRANQPDGTARRDPILHQFCEQSC